MRMNPGGVRELHWHKEAEWGFMHFGSARLTAVDEQGRSFVGRREQRRRPALPGRHSAFDPGTRGRRRVPLVFDNGSFAENETFLVTDWLSHVPRSVLAGNFGADEADFADLPAEERWIFPANVPGPLARDRVLNPQGALSDDHFVCGWWTTKPIDTGVGTARIVDSSNFPVATTIAAALV